MKIIVTSDLHLGLTDTRVIQDFAETIAEIKPDVVVIAGDVAEVIQDVELFGFCVSIFTSKMPNIPILVLPGNHDLWTTPDKKYNSLVLWESQLPLVTEQNGGVWLERSNWVSNGIAIVGSMLHYDFSAGIGVASCLPSEFFREHKSRFINDSFIGLPDDVTFANQIGQAFQSRLLEAQNDIKIHSIIVITHVPCLESQMTRKHEWVMSAPYFGNLSHTECLMQCSKIKWVVSGHSHHYQRATIPTATGVIETCTLGSQYGAPVYEILDV